MPTQKQKSWYWREWGLATAECKKSGLPIPDRHALTKQALGVEKSMLDLTNNELDLVIAAFRALSRPNSVDAQLRQIRQPRTRMLWKITNELPPLLAAVLDTPDLAAAESYILAIVAAKYHSPSFLDLSDDALSLLITDITRAINRRRGKMTWPQVRAAAEKLSPATPA